MHYLSIISPILPLLVKVYAESIHETRSRPTNTAKPFSSRMQCFLAMRCKYNGSASRLSPLTFVSRIYMIGRQGAAQQRPANLSASAVSQSIWHLQEHYGHTQISICPRIYEIIQSEDGVRRTLSVLPTTKFFKSLHLHILMSLLQLSGLTPLFFVSIKILCKGCVIMAKIYSVPVL